MIDPTEGSFRAAYTANGVEFEVRMVVQNKTAMFFAVFPNFDVPVISEPQRSAVEAARAGNEITEVL